ncbi:hypothetical protein TNCV_802541 [Trichonephila clavipes]|nr:hypothetical protein TNCV_802541 [Trichonephila clavipes]
MGTPTARNVAPAGSEYEETVRSNHCSYSLYEFLTSYAMYCLFLRVIGGAFVKVRALGLLLRKDPGPQEVSIHELCKGSHLQWTSQFESQSNDEDDPEWYLMGRSRPLIVTQVS